eukprot:scaffold28570_cov101-Isochrysis_galbana.AAC.1
MVYNMVCESSVCRRSEVQVLASKSTCLRVARSTTFRAYAQFPAGFTSAPPRAPPLHTAVSPPPTLSITSRINGQAVKHRAGPRPASRHKAQRARPMVAAARQSAHTDCRLGNSHVTPFSKEISPGSRASIRGSWHPGCLAARSAARAMGG